VPACKLAKFCNLGTVRAAYIHWEVVPTMVDFQEQIPQQGRLKQQQKIEHFSVQIVPSHFGTGPNGRPEIEQHFD
jgi:hypothetical protein